ncbi:MAG: hypothetical protein GXO91_01815 [FCB group bacterium]|nr:hypothetical protein [FCB group bacterium]
MSNNTNEDFLAGIHRKINRKKRQHAALRMVGTLVVTVIITFQASDMIHHARLNEMTADIKQNIESIHEYDTLFEISDDKVADYLIDEMEIYDLLQIAEEDIQNTDLLKTIIREG